MAQLHLTLEEDFLQVLLLPNDGEPMRKLMEKIVNTLISQEAEEQIGASAYERKKRGLPTATAIAKENLRQELEQLHRGFPN